MLDIKLLGMRHIYFKPIFIEKRIDLHISIEQSGSPFAEQIVFHVTKQNFTVAPYLL